MRDAGDSATSGCDWGFVGSVQRGGVDDGKAGIAVGVLGADVKGVLSIGGEPGKSIAGDIADIGPVGKDKWVGIVAGFVTGCAGRFSPAEGDAVVGDAAGRDVGGRGRGALRERGRSEKAAREN